MKDFLRRYTGEMIVAGALVGSVIASFVLVSIVLWLAP